MGSWFVTPNPKAVITYGQDENGYLIFPVRIVGLPAMPESAERVAEQLCEIWAQATRIEYDDPLIDVRIQPPDKK